MKNVLLRTGKLFLFLYLLVCVLLYFFQEKLLFFPEKLDRKFRFAFNQPFTEMMIEANDGKRLNGILFKSDSTKGLVFYLHGNAGSLRSWGKVAKTYTALHYDLFLLDYRGYGKSEGTIQSQEQLFEDVQAAYNEMKKQYREDRIVVLGYSVGTGLAAELAASIGPRLLILQAPYVSLTAMMKQNYPVIPIFLLKYKLPTCDYLKACKMPVVLFHGNKDEVIPYSSSIELQNSFKPSDTLITLNNQGHNGMTDNPEYRKAISKILD